MGCQRDENDLDRLVGRNADLGLQRADRVERSAGRAGKDRDLIGDGEDSRALERAAPLDEFFPVGLVATQADMLVAVGAEGGFARKEVCQIDRFFLGGAWTAMEE